MFQICRENQNTHFMFNNFFSKIVPVCEIMWKNISKRASSQMTIWRMHIVCWIPKVTNTHSEYVIHVAFQLQQRLNERDSTWLHTYSACLVLFSSTFHLRSPSWRGKYSAGCYASTMGLYSGGIGMYSQLCSRSYCFAWVSETISFKCQEMTPFRTRQLPYKSFPFHIHQSHHRPRL